MTQYFLTVIVMLFSTQDFCPNPWIPIPWQTGKKQNRKVGWLVGRASPRLHSQWYMLVVLNSQVSRVEPVWFVAFAYFHNINTPIIDDFSATNMMSLKAHLGRDANHQLPRDSTKPIQYTNFERCHPPLSCYI